MIQIFKKNKTTKKKRLYLKHARLSFLLVFAPPLVLPLSPEGETLKLKLAAFLGGDTRWSITLLLTFRKHQKHKELNQMFEFCS